MKAHLLELVRAADPSQGRNIAREYLQARILGVLQHEGAMVPLAFQGGTCLRFLFALPRYSEDLDFTLEGDATRYDLRAYLKAVRTELAREGYVIGLSVRDRQPVQSAFVRVRGNLHEAGLSPHPEEALAVKIEVDTHPPAGAVVETRLVRRHLTLRLCHHDRASLLAGKLHAILRRPYTKGRDLYDLTLVPERSDVAGAEPCPARGRATPDRRVRGGAGRSYLARNGGHSARHSGLGTGGGGCSSVPGARRGRGVGDERERAAARDGGHSASLTALVAGAGSRGWSLKRHTSSSVSSL